MSKPNIRRAMLLLQALFTEAERRGHTVEGDRILVNGHGYSVSVTEKRDRTPHEPSALELAEHARRPWQRIPEFDYTPNGMLQIHLPRSSWATPGRRRTWSDGKRGPLDKKLAQILQEIEERSELDELERLERALQEAARERARQEEQRRAHLQAVEDHRAEHVAEHVRRWKLATDTRALCDALDAHHGPSDWTNWARSHADALDPTRTTPALLPDEPKPTSLQHRARAW